MEQIATFVNQENSFLFPLNAFGDDAQVFHAGTSSGPNGEVLTSGGRVLCVTALGDNVKLAQKRAYEVAAQVRFDGVQYRKDIGYRAVSR